MIDFSNCQVNNKFFNGSNGTKKSINYKDERYLLKIIPTENYNNSSYGAYSEYVSSHIFEFLDVDVHQTLLGTYLYNNKPELAVACLDFEKNGLEFSEFSDIVNSLELNPLDTFNNKHDTFVGTISNINKQNLIDPSIVLDRFYTQFIIDAFIGNYDRHNGNWGFLINSKGECRLSPVYDNGSSLGCTLKDSFITRLLHSPDDLAKYNNSISSSLTDINKKMLNYRVFLGSNYNLELTKKLDEIISKIDLEKITSFVQGIDQISDVRKDFTCRFLQYQKNNILEKAYFNCKQKDVFITDIEESRWKKIREHNYYQRGNFEDLYLSEFNSYLLKNNQTKIYSTQFDTEFSRLLLKEKVKSPQILKVLNELSPFSFSNDDYSSKILSKAANSERAKIPFEILKEDLSNDILSIHKPSSNSNHM